MIQRQLGGNWLVETGYSGSETHKISVYQIANVAPNAAGAIQPRRLISKSVGLVTPISSLGNANYHSFRLRAEKRFSKGLSFITAYTFSKSIDDAYSRASTGQGSMPQNPFRLDLERALWNTISATLPAGRDLDCRPRRLPGSAGRLATGRHREPSHRQPVLDSGVHECQRRRQGSSRQCRSGRNSELSGDQRSPKRWLDRARSRIRPRSRTATWGAKS